MKKCKSRVLSLSMLLLPVFIFAQKPTVSPFGKVAPSDFKPTSSIIDSGASAVILQDIASSDFEGNNNSDFELVYKRHRRILILKRSAFDLANVSLSLYIGGSTSASEKLAEIEAVTYTLDGDNITTKKLGKEDVMTEKVTTNQTLRKFSMPDIKEGCIIEYQYTIRSPYYDRLRSWSFQSEYPTLWSEYTVTILPLFDYVVKQYGYIPYTINEAKQVFKRYVLRDPGNAMRSGDTYTLTGDATVRTIGIKDLPSFKSESYTSTSANHISRIQFELRAIRYSPEYTSYRIKAWNQTVDEMRNDPDFSKQLFDNNDWLSSDVKAALKGDDYYAKAKSIFDFVRDNYTCTDHDDIWLSQSLKKTQQLKKGNVADINMLLSAMLVKAGFAASPVILSTRDNGMVDNTVALLSQYNYVITKLYIENDVVLLDASQKLGFGELDPICYNGGGRSIENPPYLVSLSPDSISNEDMVSINLVSTGKGKLEGLAINWLGKYESMDFRSEYLNKSNAEILKAISGQYPKSINVKDLVIDSLKNYDFPVVTKVKLSIDLAENDEDIIYFTPFLQSAYTKNPFASAERLYPVEMPYCMNDTYLLTIDVPQGYEIDEVPKSTRVHFNETEGMYEFIVSKQENKVKIRSKLTFNKATFSPDEYNTLRDFFAFIVKKQSEMIVFKKK